MQKVLLYCLKYRPVSRLPPEDDEDNFFKKESLAGKMGRVDQSCDYRLQKNEVMHPLGVYNRVDKDPLVQKKLEFKEKINQSKITPGQNEAFEEQRLKYEKKLEGLKQVINEAKKEIVLDRPRQVPLARKAAKTIVLTEQSDRVAEGFTSGRAEHGSEDSGR